MKKLYLTTYENDAIWEPAEGGYYVETCKAVLSVETTEAEAQAKLDEIFADVNGYYDIVNRNESGVYYHNRYIGEGGRVELETEEERYLWVSEYHGYC